MTDDERDYSTSWIVQDHVAIARAEVGVFRRSEWRYFLYACGLSYDFDYLPSRCNAVIHRDMVVFRNGIDADEIADAAFQEGSQALFLPPIDIREWLKCPGGDVMVRKLKRRARGFAVLFPVRADDDFSSPEFA